MNDCECGKPVRLGATRITLNRKRGVAHAILHQDGTAACHGEWVCIALKPYCKDIEQREYAKLVRRWEAKHATTNQVPE